MPVAIFGPFAMRPSQQFKKLVEQLLEHDPATEIDKLQQAYALCVKLYRGRHRASGETCLAHAINVTQILTRFKPDVATLVAAMLIDIVDQELSDVDALRQQFGAEVGELVASLANVRRLVYSAGEEQQAENFRKMLLSMAKDIRVILVQLADRLHSLRTLEKIAEKEQRRFARETLAIYAPLANRLGVSWLKCELEDLSLRYAMPDVYFDLRDKVARNEKSRSGYIDQVKRLLLEKIGRQGIKGICYGRYKHLYSIHRKMVRQKVGFEEVYDLIAFRVIVQTVPECYAVLGVIHAAWKPVPGRFKDFIAMPKPNMYQSLHTTVIGPFGERMEVQIRTEEMHRIAEEGIAAHWRYKEVQAGQAAASEVDEQVGSLRQVLGAQQEEGGLGLLDALNTDLFSDEVYVFTPKGTVKAFPRGATPIDFAYSVHTDIGNRCSGARVNGKLVPLKTELHNGDIVEVITSATQKPSKDWLKFVKTSRAASKIRQWIKAEQREKSILLGRELLEKRLRKYGFSIKRALQSSEMESAMQELGFHTADDLLAAIGYGKLSLGQVVGRVVPEDLLKPEAPKEKGRIGQVLEKIHRKPSSAIKIQGIDDIMVRYAKCCNPLPGDPVVGFITRGRGITVHAADCPGVVNSDPQRCIEVEWDLKKKSSHLVKVRVFCLDQKGILANISGTVSNCEANIISAQVHTTGDSKAQIDFTIDVQDRAHLNRVTKALQQVKGVSRVERMRG